MVLLLITSLFTTALREFRWDFLLGYVFFNVLRIFNVLSLVLGCIQAFWFSLLNSLVTQLHLDLSAGRSISAI